MNLPSSFAISLCVACCLTVTGCKDDKNASSEEESSGMKVMTPALIKEHKQKALEEADLPPIAESAPTRFPARKGQKWGYIDREGNLAIEVQYEDADDFYEGLAAVKVNGLFGYIDGHGEWAIEPQFSKAGRFSEGLAAVRPDGKDKLGFVDRAGKMVIPAQFTWYIWAEKSRFGDGLAPVRDRDKENVPEGAAGDWGYIDTTGEWAIAPQFDRGMPFSEGLAPAGITSDETAFIDTDGNVVLEGDWKTAHPFSEGLAAVARRSNTATLQWHYIDKEGDTAVMPVFGEQRDSTPPAKALPFSEGLGAIYHDGAQRWEFIEPVPHGTAADYTKLGPYIKYKDASPFRGGLARVKAFNLRDRQTPAYTRDIDRKGNQIWPKGD